MINTYEIKGNFAIGHYESTDEEAMILESGLSDWDKLQELDALGNGFQVVSGNKVTSFSAEAVKLAMKVLIALEEAEFEAEERY